MNLTPTQSIKTAAALVLLGLASGFLFAAQEPGTGLQTNDVTQAIGDALQTNGLPQIEDMIPANDYGPSEEPTASNGSVAGSNDGANAAGPSDYRHSGRESRSRRFSSQKSSQSDRGSAGDSTAGGASLTGTNRGPVSLDYSTFKVVADRNIFNPNRYPHYSSYRPRTPDPEYFALVGLMSYEKGEFAFFSGSRSAYQKALRLADSIAGYKVTAIAANSVRLARQTNEVQLSVGMQMRRDEDGAWQPATASSVYETRSAPDNPGSNLAPATAVQPVATSGGTESDVIKRMMQRREQE